MSVTPTTSRSSVRSMKSPHRLASPHLGIQRASAVGRHSNRSRSSTSARTVVAAHYAAAVIGSESSTIVRLVGVYNAESTLRGELAYWIGARLGRAHCALCDITHGLVREKSDWKTCSAGLPIPFATYHLNDQPENIRAALGGIAPAVVAETATGIVMLLGPQALEECAGSPDRLMAAIELAAAEAGLAWSAGSFGQHAL